MKLDFSPTADPRALDVTREGRLVGSLQWHPERAPRLVPYLIPHPFCESSYSLDELSQMTDKLAQMSEGR